MGLVDLPTEVFQDIVHILVRDVGVASAFKYRHVCRRFASEIYEDVVARQDLAWVFDDYSDFYSFYGNRFFISFCGDILHRRLATHSSEGFTFIKELTRALVEFEGSGSATLEEQYARDICRAFSGVYMCPESMHRWTRDTENSDHDSESSASDRESDSEDQDVVRSDSHPSPLVSESPFSEVWSEDEWSHYSPDYSGDKTFSTKPSQVSVASPAAASAVGNLALLQNLISCPENIMVPRWLGFPTPLQAAVANDRVDVVNYILDYAFPSTRTISPWNLNIALRVAVRKSRLAIGKQILDRISEICEGSEEWPKDMWSGAIIDSCIEYGNYDLLLRLLPPRSEDVPEDDVDWVKDDATWVSIHRERFMQLYREGKNIGGLVAAYGYNFIDRVINLLGVDPPPKLDRILNYECSYQTRVIPYKDGGYSTKARSIPWLFMCG